MIVPDVNLLLYAHIESFAEHARARAWWEAALSGQDIVGMPWPVLVGFVRLATSRQVFREPLRVCDAMEVTDQWMAAPALQLIVPGPKHYPILRRLISATPGGNVTADAHLAALAIEHSAVMYTNDSDFGRFSGLKWVNPLKP